MQNKVLYPSATLDWVARQRSEGRTIGFTCGAFDILHAGHVDYLQRARALCDRLLVAVNSDESVQHNKSPLRPIIPDQQRMQVVAALGCVDAVTLMRERRPLDLLRRYQPDYYIKGGDYSSKILRSAPAVESYGGKVITIPVSYATSTSAIVKRIQTLACYAEPEPAQRHEAEKIIFLDRDGTLIRDVPFLHDPTLVELLPGVAEGLSELQESGFRLVIVTNQQGIGLGYYSVQDFIEVNRELFRLLAPYRIRFSRIYVCPHSYADGCECRKPKDLLLQRAIAYFAARPHECFMIGNSASDAAAARQAGCGTVIVGAESVPCDFQAGTFEVAARWILNRAGAGIRPEISR